MKNKKILIFLTISIASLVLGFIIYLNFFSQKDDEEIFDSYEEDILLVNELHPTDIVLYGDGINFRKSLKYRKIDDINDDTLAYDTKKYERLVLIINDLKSTVNISDEEYIAIKKGLEENKIDLLYYGTTKMDGFIKHKIFDYSMSEDQLGVGLCRMYKNYMRRGNIWTKYDQEISDKREQLEPGSGGNFPSIILASIASCIKSNY